MVYKLLWRAGTRGQAQSTEPFAYIGQCGNLLKLIIEAVDGLNRCTDGSQKAPPVGELEAPHCFTNAGVSGKAGRRGPVTAIGLSRPPLI